MRICEVIVTVEGAPGQICSVGVDLNDFLIVWVFRGYLVGSKSDFGAKILARKRSASLRPAPDCRSGMSVSIAGKRSLHLRHHRDVELCIVLLPIAGAVLGADLLDRGLDLGLAGQRNGFEFSVRAARFDANRPIF